MDRRRAMELILPAVLVAALVALALYRANTAGRPRPSEPTAVAPELGEPARADGRIMGTFYQFIAVPAAGREADAQAANAAALAALERIDRLMSTYKPDSDLSRLNAAGAGEAVAIDPELARLLALSREITAASDGAFDPTASPLFQLWRRVAREDRLPTPEELAAAEALTGWDKLTLGADRATKSVAGLQIDLSAIAKGYAVDQALEALRAAGLAGGLVDVGGEVRVFGVSPAGGEWRVAIEHPFRPHQGRIGVLAIRDVAVATSGNYEQNVTIGGRRYSHIVDPRTGQPADATPSVTVIAGNCTVADAWATALSVLGPEGLPRVRAIPGLEAMLVTGTPDDHAVHATEGFGAYLAEAVSVD